MESLFNDLEGLRIAIEIEKRGFNFYKTAYEKVSDKEAKELFKILMEEEQKHLGIFTGFFAQIEARKEAHSAEYLFDAEVSRYLAILAQSHVFPSEENANRVITELATAGNIIKLAINAEKDSILLYDELAKCSKFKEAQTVFLQLKQEEQGHVVEISNKLKSLSLSNT